MWMTNNGFRDFLVRLTRISQTLCGCVILPCKFLGYRLTVQFLIFTNIKVFLPEVWQKGVNLVILRQFEFQKLHLPICQYYSPLGHVVSQFLGSTKGPFRRAVLVR